MKDEKMLPWQRELFELLAAFPKSVRLVWNRRGKLSWIRRIYPAKEQGNA